MVSRSGVRVDFLTVSALSVEPDATPQTHRFVSAVKVPFGSGCVCDGVKKVRTMSTSSAVVESARFLTDLVAVFAFPPHTSGFVFQVLDLTHTWSDSFDHDIDLGDILVLAAAVHMYIKFNSPLPQQQYPRTLPELLTAIAELLTRHQPHDVPALHAATDFLRRLIAPVSGRGGVTLSYICPHCNSFPVEDFT